MATLSVAANLPPYSSYLRWKSSLITRHLVVDSGTRGVGRGAQLSRVVRVDLVVNWISLLLSRSRYWLESWTRIRGRSSGSLDSYKSFTTSKPWSLREDRSVLRARFFREIWGEEGALSKTTERSADISRTSRKIVHHKSGGIFSRYPPTFGGAPPLLFGVRAFMLLESRVRRSNWVNFAFLAVCEEWERLGIEGTMKAPWNCLRKQLCCCSTGVRYSFYSG